MYVVYNDPDVYRILSTGEKSVGEEQIPIQGRRRLSDFKPSFDFLMYNFHSGCISSCQILSKKEGLLETMAVPETMEDCPNTDSERLLSTLIKAETEFCLNMALDETVKGFREAVGADGLLVEPNCAADSFSCALIAKPEALVLKKIVLAGADAKAAVLGLNNP